jgi:hypothetical protein
MVERHCDSGNAARRDVPDERTIENAWSNAAAYKQLPKNVRASVDRFRAELQPDRGPVD